MKYNTREIRYFDCPHCGQAVRTNAAACPYCGSDADTGWRDNFEDQEDDDAFDYDEFVDREFGTSPDALAGKSKLWQYVTWLLLASMLLGIAPLFF